LTNFGEGSQQLMGDASEGNCNRSSLHCGK